MAAFGTMARYWSALWAHWKVLLTGVLALVIASIGASLSMGPWQVVLVLAAITLVAAQFFAWRDADGERWALQRRMHETRYGLGLATVNCNLALHPTEPFGELQVDLILENRTDVALAYQVERATVAMDGGPPLSWSERPGVLAPHAQAGFHCRPVRTTPPPKKTYSGLVDFVAVDRHPDIDQAAEPHLPERGAEFEAIHE